MDAVGPSDAELVRRIAHGDREAEAAVYVRMARRIRLYGLRHLRSSSAADDLVQQVLVTVLEALRGGRLRDSDKLAPFVLGTCRMTVLDLRRTAHRQDTLLAMFGDHLAPTPSSMPTVDDGQLARCVQALSERERTVVMMVFYDEHTARQTADCLGTSEANVRVIRHRALKHLRVCMEAAR